MTWAWLLARRLGARGWAVLAAIGAVLYGWLRWRGMQRKVAEVTVERDVAKGQAEVAIAVHEATVIVDDRQAEAREVAHEAETAPAVLAATTPAERVDAATDLLRGHHLTPGHGIDKTTASKRAGDRVRAKITTAKRKGGK